MNNRKKILELIEKERQATGLGFIQYDRLKWLIKTMKKDKKP